MKILVLGGAGYIGSHFVLEASKKGNDITVFDDLSSGFKSNLNDNIPFYKGSTLSKKELDLVMLSDAFDVVVHLAALKLLVSLCLILGSMLIIILLAD